MTHIPDGSLTTFGMEDGQRSMTEPEQWPLVFSEDGGVDFYFSDRPLEAMRARDAIQGEQMAQSEVPTSTESDTTSQAKTKTVAEKQSLAEQLADLIEQNPVIVFSKSYCPHCKATKSLLASKGVKVKVIELDIEANGLEI